MSKEIRYRLWWALSSLERILAVMTGRPTSFSDADCTAPLPLPVEEETFLGDNALSPHDITLLRRLSSQESRHTDCETSTPSSIGYSANLKMSPNDSTSPGLLPLLQERRRVVTPCNALYFECHTKLCIFANEVLNRLYRAGITSKSWADVQVNIAILNSKIEKLRGELPSVFDFTKKPRHQQFVRQRMSLGFFHYSILIMINRPCLCRLDRKIPDQSGKANDFNREAAMRCVHAAQDMLEMLPQEPNSVGLYTVAPWWSLVHYLMQAATVLMLELSFRSDHMPDKVEDVFDSAKKATDWLRSLSEDNEGARRAWSLCDEMLRKVAPKAAGSRARASKYGAASYHPGPAADQMQVVDTVQVTQGSPTGYLPQQGYTSSAPFHQPIFSSYDQFLSYGQLPTTSAPGPYSDMYPSAIDMDAIQYDGHDQAGYLHQPSH